MHYYKVYCAYGGTEGMTYVFSSEKDLQDEDEIVDEAIANHGMPGDDEQYVQTAEQIDKDEYDQLA
jgi:hypothetical protein